MISDNRIQDNKNKKSFLSFRLGKEIFAISVLKVLEVLEIRKIVKVPKTPKYMKGVINLRGEVLPVIDMRIKFNMPEKKDISKTVVIVLEIKLKDKTIKLGALSDSVKDVLSIFEDEINPVPDIASNYDTNFIIGMTKVHDEFIMILDIDKIFSVEYLDVENEVKTHKNLFETKKDKEKKV